MPGYSGTPLIKKLGIKDSFRILIINEPAELACTLGPLPDGVEVCGSTAREMDFIHFFTKSQAELAQALPRLKTQIVTNGMIWVSWPKKSSGVETDVTEDLIRKNAIGIGLVDIKVCAVTDVWSGLKLVIPVKDRRK